MNRGMPRARWLLTMLLGVLAACGAPAAPGGNGSGMVTPSRTGLPASTEPTAAGGPTAPAASGATIRVANVWAEPQEEGKAVELRVRGDDEAAPLLEVAPGTVSEFVDIPRARFGDSPANLVVVASGDLPADGIGVGEVQPGDRVTVIVHGEARDGAIEMRVAPVWELGEPFYGGPWPDVGSDKATLAVYPGPLLVFETSTMTLRTSDGECLVETTFGDPQESGFGGTGAYFFVLEPGTTTLHATSRSASGCSSVDPDIGTVEISADAGDRVGIIPWGSSGKLDLLLLDLTP
jgi:hypothetical protein